eukprot:scaffold91759_cov30-Attheya_sp.AAC.1
MSCVHSASPQSADTCGGASFRLDCSCQNALCALCFSTVSADRGRIVSCRIVVGHFLSFGFLFSSIWMTARDAKRPSYIYVHHWAAAVGYVLLGSFLSSLAAAAIKRGIAASSV